MKPQFPTSSLKNFQVGIRAVMSKIVHPDEMASALASLSFALAVVGIVVPTANVIYAATLDGHEGLIYCIFCTVLIISLSFAGWIYVNQRRFFKKFGWDAKVGQEGEEKEGVENEGADVEEEEKKKEVEPL